MKKIACALIALFLIPAAAALAADKEPTLYESKWLGVKYYELKDVLAYKGADKKLLDLQYAFKTLKAKTGVVFLTKPQGAAANFGDYAANVYQIGEVKISSAKDLDKWLKNTATAREKYLFLFKTARSAAPGMTGECHSEVTMPEQPTDGVL